MGNFIDGRLFHSYFIVSNAEQQITLIIETHALRACEPEPKV
ncbi:MAG: hypothetical protein WB949_16680 [Candidatus Acidiferrales bacterium]